MSYALNVFSLYSKWDPMFDDRILGNDIKYIYTVYTTLRHRLARTGTQNAIDIGTWKTVVYRQAKKKTDTYNEERAEEKKNYTRKLSKSIKVATKQTEDNNQQQLNCARKYEWERRDSRSRLW